MTGSITVGGAQRTYLLHVPTGYAPNTPIPLILNLPGTGMTAQRQEWLSKMSTTADAHDFLVVYPTGSGNPLTWDIYGSSDIPVLSTLVTTLEGQLCIDTSRVGVAGFSSGAVMSYHLACSNVAWVAAITPVDGELPGLQRTCQMAHPMPLMAFNGVLDPMLPYNGSGLLPSIPALVAGWAAAVGCPSTGKTGFVQGDVVQTVYSPCTTGADTSLYTVTDGGHQWPGGNSAPGLGITTQVINASSLIYSFVVAHPLH